MDRLKKYNFKDEYGHPLENCKDYIDIFTDHEVALSAVQRAMLWWRERCRETQGLLNEAVTVSRAQAENFMAMKHRAEAAEAKLRAYESHGPDGHNVTNAQYRAVADKLQAAEEALDALYVLQNGAPLIEDAEEWNAAMKKASDILSGHVPSPSDHIEGNLTMVSEHRERWVGIVQGLISHLELCRDMDFPGDSEGDRAVLASVNSILDEARSVLSSAPTPQPKVRIA